MEIFLEFISYNGELLGANWFSADITQEELTELYPNGACFNIIDWHGFGPINANCFTIEEINKIYEIVDRHGFAPLVYMDLFGCDLDFIEDWEDRFVGVYPSSDLFIDDYLDVHFPEVPDMILSNLNYTSLWEDIRHDYMTDYCEEDFYVFYA